MPSRKKVWRCFHCDEVFTDRREAALHFGKTEDQEPLCVIITTVEKDIWRVVREAEDRAAEYRIQLHDESTDGEKAYHELRGRYNEAVRLAEQRGYERGLDDYQHQLIALTLAAGGRLVVEKHHFDEAAKLSLVRSGQSEPRAEIYELERKTDGRTT